MIGLLDLPPEILANVMEFADWDDVLRLRQCCLVLCGVSRMRSVWLELLKGYCDTLFYRPFFLKKPLEFCSAEDLEESVTRAWKPVSFPIEEKTVSQNKNPGDEWTSFAGPTPDGSCLLYIGDHGELSYYFIDGPSEPHLLIPSPFECSCTSMTTRVTIDHFASQGIDPADQSSFEARLFPKWFNVAVLHNICHATGRLEVLTEVWQVTAALRGGRLQGYTGKRLASFHEDPTFHVIGCSLRGSQFAYQPCGSFTIVVVDWTVLPEKSTDYPRVYLREDDPVNCLVLIPGKRLVTRTLIVKIWEWGKNGLVSCLKPPEVRRRLCQKRIVLGGPSWKSKFDQTVIARDLTLNPFFANGSTRFVLPTPTHIFGLDISPLPIEEGLNPKVSTLFEQYVMANAFKQSHGYRRGVCVLKDQTTLVVRYPWPDDPVHRPSKVDRFSLSGNGDQVLYDDAHSRIALIAPKDLMCCSVYL